MKNAEKLFKELLNENLGYIDLKPINKIEATPKADYETKFAEFLAEESKREKEDEAVKVDSKKVAKTVEEIEDNNYDYKDPKNLNNQIGQEVLNGIYFEAKQNPDKNLEEIREIVSKNLAQDRQYYIKNAAFGVDGIGYEELEVKEVSGKYAASGYSDKLKEYTPELKQVVKESLLGGGIVTSGNPNSLAAMSGEVIKQMMAETEEMEESYDEFQRDDKGRKGVDKKDKGEEMAFGAGVEKGEKIEKKKMRKAKKESLDNDLAEIDKQASIVAMEAKLAKIDEVIQAKQTRISMVSEDENLSELMDKKKMKDMQKEVKLLEKRKAKMEKLYEKMAGKSYQREEMVDEVETINEIGANDMVVSYRDEEKIPIKFTGFEAFDGRDGGQDTTDNKGRFVVRMKAERVDGQKLAGKDKFSVQVVTDPGVSKITPDGTIPFPDHDRYSSPEVVDYGNTIKYIKDNI